jgi:hypothetical protein
VLAASLAGMMVNAGALHLAELVRAQGGAPWQFAALQRPVATALAFAYLGALLALLRARDDAALLADARLDDGDRVPARRATHEGPERSGRLLERIGLLLAAALGVAVFFGGWQLPFGIEARSTVLQLLAALLFVAKTWTLVALLLGAASIASPWTRRDARRFVVRRLVPALVLGGALLLLSRRLPASESLEAAVGATAVTALGLLVFRTAVRIRGALIRPETHASPFL